MKERLDVLLINRGLAPSREKAKTMIMEGNVFVNNNREDKAGSTFPDDCQIEIHGNTLKYVSRGGLKLEKAMTHFGIRLEGKVCMDIGASTGGFTDCMLQNGASKVYSVDVGYGQFAWKLRQDPRVVCMEKTNIRYVTPEDIADKLDFASVDVSFISLTKVLGPAYALLKEHGQMVCLIKPQFEAGREKVGKKGVVRDKAVHEEVIEKVIAFALETGFSVHNLEYSPIKGPEGNIEYLVYIEKDEDLHLSRRIVSYIEDKGGRAGISVSNIEGGVAEDFPLKDIPGDTECIMVLGGDGTLIRAATKVESLGIPLIGVNLGTLGYLCELEETNVFEAIDRLMADNYTLEERIMLSAQIDGSEHTQLALNDVVIHWAGDLSMLQLGVYVNGNFLTTYHADGIIVATPTGSTGYNLSAGGPIVDPKSNMLLLTPINAHDLNGQSIVLSADDVVEIEMGSRRFQKDEKACVSFDGDTTIHLKVGDRLKVAKGNSVIQICKLNNQSFLEILRKKMQR